LITKDQITIVFTSLKQGEQKLNQALEDPDVKDKLVIMKAKEILDLTAKSLMRLATELRFA